MIARELARESERKLANLKKQGVKELVFNAVIDDKTSNACKELNGAIIPIAIAKVGVNIPPLHPNCRSSFAAYNDSLYGRIRSRFEETLKKDLLRLYELAQEYKPGADLNEINRLISMVLRDCAGYTGEGWDAELGGIDKNFLEYVKKSAGGIILRLRHTNAKLFGVDIKELGIRLARLEQQISVSKAFGLIVSTPKRDIWDILKDERQRQGAPTSLSENGARMLMSLELSYADSPQLFAKDGNGNVLGVYPYYVYDGGVTFGFGYYIQRETSMRRVGDDDLLKKYGVYNDAAMAPDERPSIQHIAKPLIHGDNYVPIAELTRLMQSAIDEKTADVRDFLKANSISLTQSQFDAMVIQCYNGVFGNTTKLYLQGLIDETAWRHEAIDNNTAGAAARWEKVFELFFGGEYYIAPEYMTN